MNARIIRRVLAAVLALAVLGIAAPTAGAAFFTPATGWTFGEQTVGTTSASYPFTLTAKCMDYNPMDIGLGCINPDTVTPAISTTGDFAQTNNCPATLTSATLLLEVSCTINVTFTPTEVGFRNGTLTAASGVFTFLRGTGLAPPPPPTQGTFNLKAAIKKCKKRFPKGPKRKKCIKKAKKRHAEALEAAGLRE